MDSDPQGQPLCPRLSFLRISIAIAVPPQTPEVQAVVGHDCPLTQVQAQTSHGSHCPPQGHVGRHMGRAESARG